ADALFAVQALDALDGVALVVQQALDAAQHDDVLGPVETPAAGPFHRADEGKPGLPEAQHMLRHAELFGGFGYGAERFRSLSQWPLCLPLKLFSRPCPCRRGPSSPGRRENRSRGAAGSPPARRFSDCAPYAPAWSEPGKPRSRRA